MQKYATQQAGRLLQKLHTQLERAGQTGDADSIHDLRVTIRRFTECLRIFGQFFPRHRARKVRKRLKRIMDLASDVRDRDIALELLSAAGSNGHARLADGLRRDRKKAGDALVSEIRRARRKSLEV